MFTDKDLDVYAYIQILAQSKAYKTSSEVEPVLRQKFEYVTHFNSYTYVMRYFRYREKIERLLAERSADPENVQACPTQVCEAAGGCCQ